MRKHLFTSESVTEGHPDKVCDRISDAVLDACLHEDANSRVACETIAKTGIVKIAGEITTNANVDFTKIIRDTLTEIGYTRPELGIDAHTCGVVIQIDKQSQDIAQGVNHSEGLHEEQGAGDQGLMFGYACKETDDFMPLPITLAHRLTAKLSEVRKNGKIPYLGPDGKAQVTVEYDKETPIRVHTIVVSNQHDEDIPHGQIVKDITKYVIEPVCQRYIHNDTILHINPTGAFVLGGPHADCGLTGRKIIVDTYGGTARHGGGAFSGKDPSKVDRSAAYAARYIAKNIVAADLADRCEVQLAYAIGVPHPVSVYINTFGTAKIDEEKIEKAVKKIFPLKPAEIIKQLDLKRPIYYQTAANGHFGNEKFPWEKLDKVAQLQSLLLAKVICSE